MDPAFLRSPKTIIANWKMYGDPEAVEHWMRGLAPTSYRVGLCLEAPLLPFAIQQKHPFVKVGAQDCHALDEGPFTGWVSPKLLAHLGVQYVLIGHSERRFFETDDVIHAKAKAALKHMLTPVICVGESLEIRESKKHLSFVSSQIRTICRGLEGPYMIAYEPRFAIGTGRIPSLCDIEDMHAHIYETLHNMSPHNPPLLYGGSVKPENASLLLNAKNVDGLLVGGASLKVDEFNGILAA